MSGLIGKMQRLPGRRADVATFKPAAGADQMPGCRSFIVAEDPADADALWVKEAWDSEVAHKASLQLPRVKASITVAISLIAGFEFSVKTRSVGRI